ncbi:MAG: glycosyltransferase family 2 protein [Bacteriovoracia bacterium]
MTVSGFTLVRNGTQFDYPYRESIRSLLPLVDELVINVGRGSDDTLAQVRALAATEPKIVLFESDWQLENEAKKRGGFILSEQTNLALERCTGDWCVYLQADEVLHEADYPAIRQALAEAQNRPDIEGLLFNYHHFYGSYDVVQRTRSAYRREVRVIRRASGARSVGDAQSFRKPAGEKLRVVRVNAAIYHYGWVRTPEAMREKTFFMDQLYHGTATEAAQAAGVPHTGQNYRYKRFWGLHRFRGSHPSAMHERIAKKGWHWDLKASPLMWEAKDLKKIASDLVENLTGWRPFEYRSYKITK